MVGLLEWTHCAAAAVVAAACILQCAALTGPNVCVEQQKYTVTKRVKYPGTVSIMTYEWCFAIPPRCPFRSTEVRDLTRLETEERIANVAMCCPGYKIKDVGCVPICPNGKTGSDCSLDCPPKKWGPNCAKDCKECANDAVCSPVTGTCQCPEGWKGERCEIRMVTTTTKPKELLTTQKTTTSMPSTSTTTETPVTTSVGTTTLQTLKQSTRSTESSKIDHKTDEVKIITLKPITETTTKASVYYKVPVTYTRAHVPVVAKPDIKTSTPKNVQTIATNSTISAEVVRNTTNGISDTTEKPESTRKPLGTTKIFPTTIKFKPKEIWIRPAQKEPEHITAVIGEKSKDRTSSDLLTIVSIAGGVMMAVITVAVIIVMVERCRKPRYDDVRKVDDVRINVVMGDDHSSPPPYVRSILHMPLPDPPTSEKCHYQPISTLDRNLKQFMRPVVVRNISPIMIENFRGILECHYDHVPRRSHVADASYCDKLRCSIAPSDGSTSERLSSSQHSLTTFSAIEALKCEAQFDEIDTTTSEPLYAQIPYHRPPSEHAVEVMNVSSSGEAVTEL